MKVRSKIIVHSLKLFPRFAGGLVCGKFCGQVSRALHCTSRAVQIDTFKVSVKIVSIGKIMPRVWRFVDSSVLNIGIISTKKIKPGPSRNPGINSGNVCFCQTLSCLNFSRLPNLVWNYTLLVLLLLAVSHMFSCTYFYTIVSDVVARGCVHIYLFNDW